MGLGRRQASLECQGLTSLFALRGSASGLLRIQKVKGRKDHRPRARPRARWKREDTKGIGRRQASLECQGSASGLLRIQKVKGRKGPKRRKGHQGRDTKNFS